MTLGRKTVRLALFKTREKLKQPIVRERIERVRAVAPLADNPAVAHDAELLGNDCLGQIEEFSQPAYRLLTVGKSFEQPQSLWMAKRLEAFGDLGQRFVSEFKKSIIHI